MDIALWIVSGILAFAYIAADVMKTFRPKEKLAALFVAIFRFAAL